MSTSTQSKRSWAVVGCDALPYTIRHRILENVHSCPSCHYEFLSEEELVDHAKTSKHDCDSKLCRKYKHIMLVPGIYCYFWTFTYFSVSNIYNYQINTCFCIRVTQDWDNMKLTWWKFCLNSCGMLDYAGKLFFFYIYIVHNMRNRDIGGLGGVKHLIIQNCIHFYRLAKCLDSALRKPSCPAKMQQVTSILINVKYTMSNLLPFVLI